jgi:hypothetical protein
LRKHTPGPWAFTEWSGGWSIYRGRWAPERHERIARVEVSDDHATGEADAKLIAAAPELADEGKTAAHHLEEAACTCVDRSQGHQSGCRGVKLAAPLRAALRKAGVE